MTALLICSLILSIATAVCAIVICFSVYKLWEMVEVMEKYENDLGNSVKGLGLTVKDIIDNDNLDGVVYDGKTKTMTIKGNLKAEGWIQAGDIKKED